MNTYLLKQLELHKNIEPKDVFKFLYQGLYGVEHILDSSREDEIRRRLEDEFSCVTASKDLLVEQISEDYSRINIIPFKKDIGDVRYLYNLFTLSAAETKKPVDLIIEKIEKIKENFSLYGFDFSEEEFDYCAGEYISSGCPAVSHSEGYRMKNHPSYRIVSNRFLKCISVLRNIKAHDKHPYIIAIDGRCASGKSTLGEELQLIVPRLQVIHMDDFYVPFEIRTEERYSVPGNNVHHERIISEIIPNVLSGKAFSYDVIDVHTGKTVLRRDICASDIYVFEGAYSLNPVFGDYYDLSIFYDIDPDLQIKRLLKRNPEKIEDFREKWIPLENEYIDYYDVRSRADIILEAD